jgi:ECF transporter S component (folate family)
MLLTRAFSGVYAFLVYLFRRELMKETRLLAFKFDVKTLVTVGMLLAIFVVLDNLSLKIGESIKVNLTFFPLAISGALFGPIWTMLMGVAGDLIGCIFTGQAPFWQLAVTSGLQGLLYGLLLFGKTGKRLSLFSVITKLIDTLIISLTLNTNILIFYGLASGTSAGWITRITKAAIEFPVYALFLAVLMPRIVEIYGKLIKIQYFKEEKL